MLVTLFSAAFVAPVMALATVSTRGVFIFPDAVPMHKRQTSGPKYECHAACGNAILDSQSNSDYCDDDGWNQLFDDCMDCALEFEIWQYYSPQVSPAARACGLDPTPKPPGGGSDDDDDTTSAAQTSAQATSSTAPEPNEPSSEPSAEPTDATEEPSEEEPSEEASEEPSAAPETSAGPKPSGTEPKPSASEPEHTGEAESSAAYEHGGAEATPEPGHTAPAEHEDGEETEEHVPEDVVPPTPTPSHVEAGAGSVGLSKMVAAVAVAAGVLASFQ